MADEAHGTGGDTASEDAHPSHHGDTDGRDGSDVDYFGLTDDEQRTLRPAKLAKAAATHLSLRDLTAEVHRLSKQDTAHITRQLKKNANAPAAAIAQALRVTLAKITEEGACRVLHDALHSGVLATAQTAELQERELAALLTADPTDLNFLADYELRDTIAAGAEEFGVSAQTRAAVWSSMICTGHEGAVAALGWLVADPPGFWNDGQSQAVTNVWAQVRVRLPGLPEQPMSLANLCDVIAGLERTGTLEAVVGDVDAVSDTASADGSVADVPTAAEVGELSPANVEALTARVTDFQARYHNVRSGQLSDVNVAMAAGRVPTRDALRAIETLATDMEGLLQGIADATGSAIADTLEQALEDLDAAATAQTTAVVLDRIGRLTSLRAPEYVAAEAAQIAGMAATVDADTEPAVLAALDALVAAIDLSGSDPQQFTELVRIVQTGLPSAAVLVMLASNGLLSISDTALTGIAPAARSEWAGDEMVGGGPSDGGVGPTASEAQAVAATVSTGSLDAEGASDALPIAAEVGAVERDDVETGPDDSAQPAGRASADTVVETNDLTAARVASVDSAPTETGNVAGAKAADAAGRPDDPATPASVEEPSIDDVLAGLDLDIPTSTVAPAGPADTPAAPATASGRVEAGPDNDEIVGGQAVDVDALYASLMDSRQYALAGWLAQTIGAPEAAASAHRLAAHALAIRTSTGPNVAAFKDVIATLDADALRDLPGGQMLVYAASVRAGLLSPTAGAADPLRDMCPAVVKCGPAVRELTDALLTCIYSGAYLAPGSSSAVAEVASLESEYADLVETARTMLDTASARSIRYAAATELFKGWMAPTGYLGAALTAVASGSRRAEDVSFVRARATELRSRSDLESAIDRDTPIPAHAKRSRRIEARARDKVIERATDVADILAAWVEATEALTQSTDSGWMSGPIADLRANVASVRAFAVAELAPLRGSETPARRASVDAGLALLESSLDLLTAGGQLDSDAELPADRVVNGILALAVDLPLNAVPTLTPRRAVTVTDIAVAAAALAADTAGWTTAFNRRTERADHVGTAVIVEMLRRHDSALARRLAAIRDRDAAASADALDERVAELAARIDSDRRFGRLDADTWAQLSIRTRALEADSRGSRRDFDRMEHELAVIGEDRVKTVAETIEAKWRELADLQAIASLTDDQAARISECIAAEDITTADEYIETIRSRGELPAPQDNFDHLMRFFPAFPAMFTAAASDLSPLAQLKRAIGAGHNPDSGELADVLTGAGIDIALIGRRSTASSRLEQWQDLAGSRTLDGRLAHVKPVLEQLGFFATKADTPNHRRGQVHGVSSWTHLTGVRGTEGGALIPAFGSKISPTGDTLRVLALWNSPTPGRLVELLRDEPADHSVLVLYFGTLGVDARRELAALLRSGPRLPTTIVVDAAAFGYLVAQPTSRRDTTMAITLPFASSAPFTPNVAGLVPVEMFYGRTQELDQILDMMGSCIVYGGRQLGKSALLRAAARKFNEGQHRKAIYQSIYKVGQGTIPADKVWATLWPRLAEQGIAPEDMPSGDIAVAAAATGHIADWVHAVPGRQLLLLLDESDFFLDADAKEGKFTHVAAFRELMEQTERAVKVVFAGLHQTARFERLANHPLAHFGDPVCVGPLTPQHAYDLLTDPLHALGYRFEDDNVAARVLALANNQPSLIQLFGAKLLTHLQRQGAPATLPQVVTAADIETVWSDESLRESFRKRFDWTLNLDPRYKIIAYAVAYHTHAYGVGSALSPTDLRSQCEQWWPQGFAAEDVRTGEFRALLDECVALGVLSYAPAEGAYRLRTPNVLGLLGSRDEVEDVLDAAESTPLPDSFDGSLLRPAYAGGITRSPLTSAQIADLLAARNQVRVIAGTEALTVARCARVLRDESAHAVYGTQSIPIKEATGANLDNACRSAAMTAGHGVVLVDLRTATPAAAAEAWTKARHAIATTVRGTIGIVLITGAAQAPLWVHATTEADASSSLTALHRYDNTGLRLWLNETTNPFQDDASRADLLAVSGGWPMLLNRVANASIGEHDADGRADALHDLREWLAQPANAETFLDALGVRTDDVLRAAWHFLVTAMAGDASDAGTLAELMALSATEDQYAALTPGRLDATGYGNTEALIDVFRTLGVLVVDAVGGQLRLEPVAAAAAASASSTTANE